MLDGNVDVLGSVGVFAVGALVEPVEDVEALGAVQLQLVAVEKIGDQSNVAVVGEGIGHQLAVLPDAQDIGQVEDSNVLVGLTLGGRGQVGDSVTIDGDVLASGLAAGSEVSVYLSLLPQLNKISCFATPRCAGKMAKLFFPLPLYVIWETYWCRLPRVQQRAGGLEAMVICSKCARLV